MRLELAPDLALALRIGVANRRRLLVTLAGASLAVALIIYQTFLIVGFVRSATAVAKGIDADLWVTAFESQAFDFGAPMRCDHAYGLRGVAGVQTVEAVLTGFTSAMRPDGRPIIVAIAGLPIERFRPDAQSSLVTGFRFVGTRFAFVNETELPQFSDVPPPFEIEVAGERATVTAAMSGYSTFLGSPFVVTTFENARRWLKGSNQLCTALAVWVNKPADAATVIDEIHNRYPELSVFDADEYGRRSAIFWLTKTGAGGGLLLSAILGFAIGILIISQNLYASVLESLQQYVTLRAFGFQAKTLAYIVLGQSIGIALAAWLIGTVMGYVFSALTKAFVLGWIAQPVIVPLVTMLLCALMGAISSASAIKLIHRIEPANALRQ